MPHISDLAPQPGERHAIFGGTRAGKSAFQHMSMVHIQATRPDAMQILVDTKPRFRAEHEKGLRPVWRKSAAHRYTSWSRGPIVPNSVVVDLWDDRPFAGTFDKPGEIVILQSGESQDWKRILFLLDGFVKANPHGRERRIIVDECLDFTNGTRWALILKTTFYIVRPELAANGTLVLIWARMKYSDCHGSFAKASRESRCTISATTERTCPISTTLVSQTKHHQPGTMCSVNGKSNRAVSCPNHSQAYSNCQNRTWRSYRQHKEGG